MGIYLTIVALASVLAFLAGATSVLQWPPPASTWWLVAGTAALLMMMFWMMWWRGKTFRRRMSASALTFSTISASMPAINFTFDLAKNSWVDEAAVEGFIRGTSAFVTIIFAFVSLAFAILDYLHERSPAHSPSQAPSRRKRTLSNCSDLQKKWLHVFDQQLESFETDMKWTRTYLQGLPIPIGGFALLLCLGQATQQVGLMLCTYCLGVFAFGLYRQHSMIDPKMETTRKLRRALTECDRDRWDEAWTK